MRSILSLLALMFFYTISYGQDVGRRITSTTVTIYNQSNKDIKIVLGEFASAMDTFLIEKNSAWNGPTYATNPLIKIRTGNHVTKYTLKLGNFYILFWNARKKYWDLKKTQQR